MLDRVKPGDPADSFLVIHLKNDGDGAQEDLQQLRIARLVRRLQREREELLRGNVIELTRWTLNQGLSLPETANVPYDMKQLIEIAHGLIAACPTDNHGN